MILRFIRNHHRIKIALLNITNWYAQTIGQLPFRWPAVPFEVYQFWKSFYLYKKMNGNNQENFRIYPILFQHKKISFDYHYTYQSAWAARRLLSVKPEKHLDIASDLRFVTQISAFLPVIYLEYRAPGIALTNLTTIEGTIHSLPFSDQSIDSLSCLHVIEHIGLGRYGDPVNPSGHIFALKELGRILAPGGLLLISVPVGKATTLFNAHRIFDPVKFPALLPGLILEEFSIVTTSGKFIEKTSPEHFTQEEYACGLYLLRRPIRL